MALKLMPPLTRHTVRSVVLLLSAGALLVSLTAARAQEPAPADGNGLTAEIAAKNEEIRRLEAEAQQYRAAINETSRAVDSLRAQLTTTERTLKRLEADVRLTNAKIARTNLEIKELGTGIGIKEDAIETQRARLGYVLRALEASERSTPLEILMQHETVSAFFTSLDALLGLQRDLLTLLADLRASREDLRDQKSRAESKRLELAALSEDLTDQQALHVEERRQRNQLLTETKNQERRYQELLAEVERKRAALQRELDALESGLTATFDSSILPTKGSGILGWPLANVSIRSCWAGGIASAIENCVTQFFGRTDFARAGAYRGDGHNGIDFRAAIGSPVLASEGGTVRAVGDTDLACRRASYGRWILIDHANNLATLYAHLSLIKVRPGDSVNRGELIGYSGRTGYATGPHLHFTVFARQAVEIVGFPSRVCGRTMTLPRAPRKPFDGYLDPLSYL